MKKTASASDEKKAVEVPLTLLNRETVADTVPPAELTPLQLNEDSRFDEVDIPDDATSLPVESASTPSAWLWWGSCAVLVLALLETGQFIYQKLSENVFLGGAWSAAIVALLIGAGGMIWREWRVLRRLRSNTCYREQSADLSREQQHGNAQAFCRRLANETGLQHSPGYQQWLEQIDAHHNDAEVLTLFSQFVLHPLDEKALQLVLASSSQTALLVAASPLALADMLLVVWRNIRMVRNIAAVYQIRLGYWGQIRLIRQILQNMVFAGATELATELGTDWFSSELTSKLSAKLAQGLGSGLMSARLGINTIQLCRPIELQANEKPRLSQIRRALLKRLSATVSQFFTVKDQPSRKG
ncbi:YcjF family protein [Tolumonas osonensis]|uniref:Putative membrane protein n=1 Tax=Tolumonas osonensis TaxID=675874 RepID=A0A841GFM1_9GAMM|nr:TIGR01620 family protein [Tolumonas osonensis]MBB6056377.1 putative membrane protein [Tolumonas osonensis]